MMALWKIPTLHFITNYLRRELLKINALKMMMEYWIRWLDFTQMTRLLDLQPSFQMVPYACIDLILYILIRLLRMKRLILYDILIWISILDNDQSESFGPHGILEVRKEHWGRNRLLYYHYPPESKSLWGLWIHFVQISISSWEILLMKLHSLKN